MKISAHQHCHLSVCSSAVPLPCKSLRTELASPPFVRPSLPAQVLTVQRCSKMLHTFGNARNARQLPVAQAVPKPMGQRSSPAKPQGPSAVEGRQLILESLPVESFKIAGVSFNGRQDLVGKLQPGECQEESTIAHHRSTQAQNLLKLSCILQIRLS